MKHLLYYGTLILALTAAVLIAPVPTPAHAGRPSCGNCYQPTYQEPEYIYVDRVVPVAYPVPFTVAVPVVSYIWNGGYGLPGYSPVYAAQPANPSAHVQSPQYTDNGAPKTSATFKLSDSDVDNLIEQIEKRLAAKANKPTSPPPPVPQETGRPQQQHWTDASVIGVLSKPLGVTQKSCASCHTAPNHKGGVKIFESSGVLNQSANWTKIWDAADSGRMPKEAQDNKAALMPDNDCEILRDKAVRSGNNK